MKRTLVLFCIAGIFAGGCSESSGPGYSSDLSSEVPKPRSDAPDFGSYQRTAPTPGGATSKGGTDGPKHLSKGQ